MKLKIIPGYLPIITFSTKVLTIGILVLFFFTGCKEKKQFQNEMDNMNWLVGTWVSQDLEYAEKWNFKDKHYSGFGYTISGPDTIPKEQMMIIREGDKILFLTKNAQDIEGKFLAFDYKPEYSDLLIFENDMVDYPRKIIYRRLPYDEMKIRFEGPGGANPKAFTMKKKS